MRRLAVIMVLAYGIAAILVALLLLVGRAL